MAHTHNSFVESDEYFNLLDEKSMPLRIISKDFEKYCINHQSQLPQLNQLGTAFHSLQTINIKKIDEAFNQIKNAFYLVTAKMSETGSEKLISADKNLEVMDLQKKFLNEVCEFVKTADDLAKNGGK